MNILKRFVALVLLSLCLVGVAAPVVFAQDASLQARIDELNKKITDLQGQEDSLAKQISLLDSKITLTTLRVDTIKAAIIKLDGEIGELDHEVERLEILKTQRLELVLKRIPQAYKRMSTSQFGVLLFSKNFSDFLSRIKYVETVQEQDANLYKQLQNTQDHFNERKVAREKKKEQQEDLSKQLVVESQSLAREKQEKQVLLSQTRGQEATYAQLLAQAKAQLAGFASFADSQGGGLLSGQTSCGDWGCYYNQRDSSWGNGLINGQGSGCGGACTIARVGCLLTSMAMMASHLGHRDITPADIAFSGPDNFSVGTAMLRKGAIIVKGYTMTRTTVASSLSPDIVKDGPVIVGLYYGQFGTHFIVVKSYTNGTYIINDPYGAGAHDQPWTSSPYSLGSVFSVDRVSM